MGSTPATRPFIIGLTGGIGSGKTVVSNAFAALGAEVIDADLISRTLVAPGQPVLQQLAALVGESILLEDGSLNRRKLRELLFRDETLKKSVELLLHPLIRQNIRQLIDVSQCAVIILVAPLLLEHNAYDFVDRVLVVDAPQSLQVSRTVARDNTSAEEVERIMGSQMPRETRLQRAHDVIVNDGDLTQLEQRVAQLHRFYEGLRNERKD